MTAIAAGWQRARRVHPAAVLAALDLVGLAIAGYLSFVELQELGSAAG